MYIFNPKNGATIRDIFIYDKLYFSVKADEEFKPGDIIDIEDKPGQFLLQTCEFLEEVSAIRAGNIIKERSVEKFPCNHEGCTFEAKNAVGLVAHKRTHESVVEGVRVVRPLEPKTEEEKREEDKQEQIMSEAKAAGLTGAGLEVT